MNSLCFTYSTQHAIRQASIPRASSKTRHNAVCEVHEHGYYVTCNTRVSVRKFTDQTMDMGSFLITASNPILLNQHKCFTLKHNAHHNSKQKNDVKRKWWHMIEWTRAGLLHWLHLVQAFCNQTLSTPASKQATSPSSAQPEVQKCACMLNKN